MVALCRRVLLRGKDAMSAAFHARAWHSRVCAVLGAGNKSRAKSPPPTPANACQRRDRRLGERRDARSWPQTAVFVIAKAAGLGSQLRVSPRYSALRAQHGTARTGAYFSNGAFVGASMSFWLREAPQCLWSGLAAWQLAFGSISERHEPSTHTGAGAENLPVTTSNISTRFSALIRAGAASIRTPQPRLNAPHRPDIHHRHSTDGYPVLSGVKRDGHATEREIILHFTPARKMEAAGTSTVFRVSRG